MEKVLIHPASYEQCREAVNLAFRHFSPEVKGKKVLVKPNVLRGSKAEDGIVTHPAVLRAVIDRLEENQPASIVVGDNPGLMGYGANEACFRETGLMEAAKGYYQNIGDEGVEVAFNPDFLDKVSVSRAIMEADVVISLPKFKTHGLTIITGAIKNSYGLLPGAQKARLHQLSGNPVRFNDVIVDVFRLRVPNFFIVDAVVGMEGNGPASTELREIGKILASNNAVALDACIARMMGVDPAGLRFLATAKELGLGDFDPSAIEVLGDIKPIPNFILPPMMSGAGNMSEGLNRLFQARSDLRPRADEERCTGCGTCVAQCPASALTLIDNLPTVDPERCITCFCCQEICPEQAIQLS